MIRDYRNRQADNGYCDMRDGKTEIPFFFTYGTEKYVGFSALSLAGATCSRQGDVETATGIYLLDALRVTVKLTHYFSHGATEWTVWFENVSERNSEVLTDLYSRMVFEGDRPVLRGILGDHQSFYEPYAKDLLAEDVSFSSDSGRATHVNFPYFNLEQGEGGTMLAIGWAGTWRADFSYADGKTTYTARSVNGIKTYLKPGEVIRTALFTILPYTVRDEQYATNLWRHWFIHCNMPRADATGAEVKPFSTACLAGDTGLPNSDGSISERHFTWQPSLEKMIAENVKVDFRWMDAGWYVAPDGHSEETDWWGSIGTWQFDPVKWPRDSFRRSTDFARSRGMKTLLWFEPERVTDPENLEKNFGYDKRWAIVRDGVKAISNNIGDPDCYRWTVDRICKTLRDNRVEMYREDNNCNSGQLWRYLDEREGDDRGGIAESKFIDAHYRMWDEIIACTLSFGGCGFVDSCASGGGRNDLESLRRGVPLLRSDADRTTTALRLSMTSSFCRWIPFCGAATKETKQQLAASGKNDAYVWRASYLPVLNLYSRFVHHEDGDFGDVRWGLEEWKSVNRYLLCEFYPLTPWHCREDTEGFTAHLYSDPEDGTGILLAFRQEACCEEELLLSLPKDLLGAVDFCDVDTGECVTATDGRLTLRFDSPRSAKLLKFSVR